MRNILLTLPAICTILGLIGSARGGESRQELADLFRTSNRVAMDGMRTFHGRMDLVTKMPGEVSPPRTLLVECWRDGANVRQKEVDATQTVEVVRSGGRLTSVVTRKEANRAKWVGAAINPEAVQVSQADLWAAALCTLPAPQVSLDSLLGGEHSLVSAGYRGNGAARLGWLEVNLPKEQRLVIAVDPSANYMIRHVEYYLTQKSRGKKNVIKSVYEVPSFEEVSPGHYFPKLVKTMHTQNGQEVGSSVATFTEVAVNRPVPPGTFLLRFPAGAVVTDRIHGTSYTVDQGGRPTSEPKRFVVAQPPSPAAPKEVYYPTTEAVGRPWWQYGLGTTLLGAVAASGIWLLRKRRRAAAMP